MGKPWLFVEADPCFDIIVLYAAYSTNYFAWGDTC